MAQNGTWTNSTSGGMWSDTANWIGGTIAEGSGFNAVYGTLALTANNTVHLDSAVTITNIEFGNTTPGTSASWILDNAGNSTNTLSLVGSTPTISVGDLGSGKVVISAAIAGASGLTKTGVGTLELSGADTLSSDININGGLLVVSGSINSLAGGFSVSQNGGSGFTLNGGSVMTSTTGNYNTASGVNFNGSMTISSGNFTKTSSAGQSAIGGFSGSGNTIWNQSGGNVTLHGDGPLVTNSDAALNFTGGTMILDMGWQLSSTGNTTLMVSSNGVGAGAFVKVQGPLELTTTSGTSVVNLESVNGVYGMLKVGSITDNNLGASHVVNLNGGQLIANASNTHFIDASSRLTLNVRNLGAFIDANNYDITICQALVHSSIGGDNAIDGGLTVDHIGWISDNNPSGDNGTVTLAGNNTFNGKLSVLVGTLRVTGSMDNLTGQLLVSQAHNSGLILDGGSITTSASGNYNQTNGFSLNGNITINSGSLTKSSTTGQAAIGGAGATLWNQSGGTVIIHEDSYLVTQGSTFNISGGSLNIDYGWDMATVGNSTLTLSGTGAVTVGGALTLTPTWNAPRSVVNLDGGTLTVNSIALANGTGNALNLNGGILTAGATSTSFLTSHANLTANVRNGGAKIDTAGFNISIAQALVHSTIGGDNAIDGGLTKIGAGSLTVSGANTYTGTTTISAGTLQFATMASLYNGGTGSWTAANINVKNGATLTLNVDSAGTAGFNSANLNILLTNISVAGSASAGLQAGARLAFDTSTATGGNFTQGNIIADSTGANGGAIGVTKLGSGTLVLDKANTYTGSTEVWAGTLLISGSMASTSPITLISGATLKNASGAAIASSLTLNEGSSLVTSAAGSEFSGAVSFSGNLSDGWTAITLTNTAGTGLLKGGAFTLTLTGITEGTYNLTSGVGFSGTFASMNVNGNALSSSDGGANWTGNNFGGFNYAYTNDTNQLIIAATPEPTTWTLLVFSLTAIAAIRRRRIHRQELVAGYKRL